MKITDINATVVTVPFKKARLWALGFFKGTTRTVVEIITDEGIVGIGETIGLYAKQVIDNNIKPALLGEDPSNIVRITTKALWRTNWTGINIPNPLPVAAIEMALWDIKGKETGKPVSDLLGGMFKGEVEFFADVQPTYWSNNKDEIIRDIISDIKETLKNYGYSAIQLYCGVFPPEMDSNIVHSIRTEFGPNLKIGIDLNRCWSAITAIKTLRAMKKYGIKNVEDATSGLEALAIVRKSTSDMIFSTHYTDVSEIARLHAADAVVGDIHDSGGLLGTNKLVAQCELFGLGFWLHSSNELGISLMANTHLIASTPYIIHPSQSTYHWLSDDIIKESPKFNHGKLKVPKKPGLGVTIDPRKLEKYAAVYREDKFMGTFFGIDPKRPEWFPKIPTW